MGMSSMSARVSGILSPIILLLGNYWAPLPLLVFGISSILAGVFALLLPETKGRPLPETLEDGENIGGEFGFENIALENKQYNLPQSNIHLSLIFGSIVRGPLFHSSYALDHVSKHAHDEYTFLELNTSKKETPHSFKAQQLDNKSLCRFVIT